MRKTAFVLVLALGACHPAPAAPNDGASVALPTPAVTATVAASGKTYTVRMKRPARVGETAHVSVDDDHLEHTVTRVAGATKEDRKPFRGHLEGTRRLVTLEADGISPLRDELTVADFWTIKNDGPKITLAPAGARVVVERGATKHDARVTVDGQAATKDVIDALDHLMSLTTHKGPSDDDVFGTKVPQPIGGEWPVDSEIAAKDLRTRDIGVTPANITGSTKLVSVHPIRGIDCLEIDNHMSISSLQSMGELPPGSTIKNARIDVHVHMLLPVDETKTLFDSSMDLTIAGVFIVPSPKGPVEVELDSTDHRHDVALP
ncbi:MAG TPA: hypothetical protein VGH87_28980 [Polyangiaceae bacterium]